MFTIGLNLSRREVSGSVIDSWAIQGLQILVPSQLRFISRMSSSLLPQLLVCGQTFPVPTHLSSFVNFLVGKETKDDESSRLGLWGKRSTEERQSVFLGVSFPAFLARLCWIKSTPYAWSTGRDGPRSDLLGRPFHYLS
jgi:hypothetical protein